MSRRCVVLEASVVMCGKRFTCRAKKTSSANQESGKIGAKSRAILGAPLAGANLEA